MTISTRLLELFHWNRLRGKPAFGAMALVADAASDGKTYGRKDGAWEEAAGGSGDFLSTLVNSEVTINGATTATIGKMHLIVDSASPADYTIALPAVSGNAGKFLGFRVSNAATKFFTIDPDGTEKIWTPRGEVATRVYVRSESCVLMCDGTRWHVLHETLLALDFNAHQESVQSISSSTTKVTCETEDWDFGGCYDNVTNYRYTPTAPGLYLFGVVFTLEALAADKQIELAVRKNGTTSTWLALQAISISCNPTVCGSTVLPMNGTTDYAEMVVFHSHGSARNTLVSQLPRFWGKRLCREIA